MSEESPRCEVRKCVCGDKFVVYAGDPETRCPWCNIKENLGGNSIYVPRT